MAARKTEKKEEKKEEMTLEEGMQKIREYISRLEQEDITLEESFQAYSEGMKVLGRCSEMIDRVEKQMEIVNES